MHPSRLIRDGQCGQSATPILVFLGIVVLSVVFFFALTLPRRLEGRKAASESAATNATPASKTASAADTVPDPAAGAGAPAAAAAPDTAPQTPAMPTRFASPREFIQTVAGQLVAGDVPAARALLGEGALDGEKGTFFETIFGPGGLRPSVTVPVREIGDVAENFRWAVRLEDAAAPMPAALSSDAGSALHQAVTPGTAGSAAAAEVIELEVDVARDASTGWHAAAVHFPEALRLAVAAKLGAASVPATIAKAAEEKRDPLKIAGHFLRAVLKQDYAVARSVTDTEQVTREKVAGLCILFEEGGYAIADQRPLSATAAGTDSAWVIVKVKSGRDGHESDFGLELRRLGSGDWQVAGVNFSKMLASYAASAGAAEGVAYSPIVKNPAGGESLVVYFDFNEAGLVPRAQRQLEIVANLLRDDPRRKLRLSGHADAVGSDAFNRRLSAARALTVKQALARLGVSSKQIVAEGLGKLQPLDPNTKPDGSDNPEGRSRNRRTEIYLDF